MFIWSQAWNLITNSIIMVSNVYWFGPDPPSFGPFEPDHWPWQIATQCQQFKFKLQFWDTAGQETAIAAVAICVFLGRDYKDQIPHFDLDWKG